MNRWAAGEVAHAGIGSGWWRWGGRGVGAWCRRRGFGRRGGAGPDVRAGRGRAAAARVARWIGGWPARRVGLAAVAGGLLVLAAVLGYAGPLLAQEGVDIRFGDLSSEPTDTTVDRFFVELSNLSAATAYEVVVASDDATALGIGSCGAASQTAAVTGVKAQDLTFVVYACTVGAGTLTATVREAGADTAAASVSQALTVLAIPEGAPAGVPGAAAAAAATRGATKAGTPGIVPSVSFDNITTNSARATWGAPSDGGQALTGFGLLFWTGPNHPNYADAFVVGAASRSHTYTGLQPNTTYKFRIHACNGADSCGHWTHPPKEFTTRPMATPTPTPTATPTANPTAAPTVGPPGQVQSLRTSNRTATSFTVHWSPHRATGGRPLTGFGLLRREPPNAWPSHDQATVVGAASRSHSFTGLTYGRGQGVRIRACNGTNSCGAWSAEVTVTPLPGPLPTLALPKTTIAIGERMKIGANDVPVGAVAYIRLEGPIQPEGRCGASGTAGAPAVPRAPAPSPGPGYYDSIWIDGCAPGGDAVVRLESQDGSVLYDRRELTVATAAPRQVGRPVVRPRDAALHVDWEAPNDGGSAITHYDVGHRAGAAGAWTETEVSSGTSTTITELTNGTSYEVRVRAVNAKGDGEWSETVTGTPQVDAGAPVVPGPGEPTLAPPACDPIPDPGSTTPTSLSQPNNLHVTPFRNRRAVLTWNPVPGAKKYVVQIRQRSATGWLNWLPPDRRAGEAASGDITTHNCYTVGLDRVITQSSGASEGLADSVAYGLRVRAVNGSVTSASSSEAIIIDSPIIEANGKSTAGAPQVKLTWLSVGDILGSDYALGTYAFHHRRLGGNHQDLGWTLGTFFPVEVFSQSSTNPDTIKQLTMEQVYAIQLRYEETGPQRTSTVFAARDAYAWPSARAADGGERVATFPMNYRVKNRTYEYRICRAGYPGNFTHWKNLVNHALGQWQLATNGLVRMVYEGDSCADYFSVVQRIKDRYAKYYGQKLTADQITDLEVFLLSLDILTKAEVDDAKLSEIIVVDQSDTGIYGGLEAMGVFPEFSERLGISTCVFADPDGNRGPTACAWPRHEHPRKGWVTDILLPWSRFGGEAETLAVPGGLDADGGVTVDRDDVPFNTCDAAPIGTYETLVHEAGHALGIRNVRSLASGWDRNLWHHPSIYESVMSYEHPVELKPGDGDSILPDDPDCSPHPLDVLAIYAMYQQESSP